uniref:hypothetical protein n=2 Tax=Flavobacterium sp. TaxID=239 RepID=UPI004049FEBA
MCKQNNEIIFCTCVDEDLEKCKYIWTLDKFIESSRLIGKILMPIEDFGNGISSEKIVEKINKENIFDFEYIPQEWDCLHISINTGNRLEYKYFSLLYEKGKWREGGKAFSRWKNIAKGEIKIIN